MLDWLTPANLVAVLVPAVSVALLRMGDVTVNVFRTVCVVQGRRMAAAGFAGLEAGLWLAAAGIALADLSVPRVVGFVGGVAAGTYLGMIIVHRAKLGTVTVRTFVAAGEGRELAGHVIAERIRRGGYGATLFSGWGRNGEVQMVLSVVRRRDAPRVQAIVAEADPRAAVAFDNDLGPAAPVSLAGQARARV